MLYDDLMQTEGQWLCHHGVKGMRWGVRRYQNKDGTLTKQGRKRFGRYGSNLINEIETAKRKTGLSYDKVGRQIINDRVKIETSNTNPRRFIGLGTAALGALGAGILGMSTGGVGFMAAPALLMGGTMVGILIDQGITQERMKTLSDVSTAYELPNLTIQKSGHRD